MNDRLVEYRRRQGLSQRDLAEMSGVSPSTIYEIEKGRREAKPSTLRKLATALGVEVTNLIAEEKKVQIEVGGEDHDGIFRFETVRFTGEEVDSYEDRHGNTFTLYKCPNGYRVYADVDVLGGARRTLFPYREDQVSDELQYSLFTSEEVAKEFPLFASSVGITRIRDID